MKTWDVMKTIIRKRFIFSHYFKESYRRLQTWSQGSSSVTDYHMEMEMSMIRANVVDDKKKKSYNGKVLEWIE